MLRRMLRLLAAYDFFREARKENDERDGAEEDLSKVYYENTPRTDVLREEHPFEVYNMLLHQNQDTFSAFFRLEDMLKREEGEDPTVYQEQHGLSFFEKMAKPEFKNHSEKFDRAMNSANRYSERFESSFFSYSYIHHFIFTHKAPCTTPTTLTSARGSWMSVEGQESF